MGQINIGLGNIKIPTIGTCGYGFTAQGKPVYIDQLGITHELYSDKSVDGVSANILANAGVGLEADAPEASAGYTYVTMDTFKIYQGIDTGMYDISNLSIAQFVTDVYNIPQKTYQFTGNILLPISGSGGATVEICEQTDVEQAEPTENTKATSALRAWQGFVYWCKNTLFAELTTTDKTLVGSINEIITGLGLKATQNPGVCAKCRIYPADIVIDPVANTISVVTVKNGQTIAANCPLRFFTDGDGVTRKWEFYAPITASFTNINGIWGFYIDNTGAVKCDQIPWSDFALIATITRFYLNDTLPDVDKIEPTAYEAHTTDISASDHEWMHAHGTIHVGGFDIVNNTLSLDANGKPTTSPNADGRNTVISLTTGKSSDDGLAHTVTNSTNGAKFSQDLGNLTAATLNATNSGLFRIRTNDISGKLSFLPATRFPFPWNAATNSPQYITTSGVRTDVADNRWFISFVYDFPDFVNGRAVKIVTAPQDFTTYALAVAYQWESIQAAYATMRDKEIRPLYKGIYLCDKSGGGAYYAGCKYTALCSTTDLRTLKPSVISAAGGATLGSNVTGTAPFGYVSTDMQSAYTELAANTIQGNITAHTLPIAADSLGILDSVAGVFKRVSLSLIKTFVLTGLSDTAVANTSTNKTGANLKLVTDGLPNTWESDTKPTIANTPALKVWDMWLDTANLIKYTYLQDSSGDRFWFNFDVGSAEIPAVASGEKVVTKTSTGVLVAKTLTEMQIAAGTIASADWSTGQATYTGSQGQTTYDTNYKYECIGTNKWIRTALMEARMQLYLTPDVDDSGGAKTSAELVAAYPSALIGQRVYGVQFEYVKKESLLWKKIACVTA